MKKFYVTVEIHTVIDGSVVTDVYPVNARTAASAMKAVNNAVVVAMDQGWMAGQLDKLDTECIFVPARSILLIKYKVTAMS